MPSFSKASRKRLETCHPDLQRLMNEVIKHWDCTVLEGHRTEHRQNEMVRTGTSQLKWPLSKHNRTPSEAVDVAPYPIDWQDIERFRAFGGFVLGVAAMLEIPIRWGGDWNGNRDFKDQKFHDLPHFELLLESP